jgi:hypothetical protein
MEAIEGALGERALCAAPLCGADGSLICGTQLGRPGRDPNYAGRLSNLDPWLKKHPEWMRRK